MINGVNTVDFPFPAEGKQKIATTDLPKARSELISVFQYAFQPMGSTSVLTKSASRATDFPMKDMDSGAMDRIRVQRLHTTTAQMHNDKCNYQPFYSTDITPIDPTANATYKASQNISNQISPNNNNPNNCNNNNNNNNNYIENKQSAFIKCNTEEERRRRRQQPQPQIISENTELCLEHSKNAKIKETNEPKLKMGDKMLSCDKITSDTYIRARDGDDGDGERNNWPIPHRTEDQENAFRCIEDVHNYAKLKRYGNSNESSDGTTEEEEDEEDDDDEVGEEQNICENDFHSVGNDAKYVNTKGNNFSESSKAASKNVMQSNSKFLEDADAIVDVETVAGESGQQLMQSPPAHHARRPMNAFLIFCKRHRAIVKDRYKSLENRAITKILGDWWASLDPEEKECFTRLAQQNKDAFFSAHPNFKWYKLPAPPLRTLSTRPNLERDLDSNEYEDMKSPRKAQGASYFKLADETQMGELNSLMMKNKNESSNQCPLQQALGETSHFLSAHIRSVGDSDETLNDKRHYKRRAVNENSFSSNSSEDDVLPKKSSRSCKGKIYQELVSSGQIAPVTKKTKPIKSTSVSSELINSSENYGIVGSSTELLHSASSYFKAMDIRGIKAKRTYSESDASQQQLGDQFGHFDLEERIKQLPALNLDEYLNRKRNTKKKKKFTTRKRNSNSVSLPITETRVTALLPTPRSQAFTTPHAVGSQKRKARKESITRRDISAIENEVASLIPLTTNFDGSNGCYYLNDTPFDVSERSGSTLESSPMTIAEMTSQSISMPMPMPMPTKPLDESSRAQSKNSMDCTTPTSDLFILAELAAKRTELTN